ncbi:MAG TPA: hypothetical protein VKW04_16015 [Planctomycetota bacterium]|nr:hypothetical protein [Planctomycetota bacterium]
MLGRRVLVLLGLAAIGVWVAAGNSASASSPRESASHPSELASSPVNPEALVAHDGSAVWTGLDRSGGAVLAPLREGCASHPQRSTPESQAFLIEAHVLEKYRPFRESLSAP